MEPVEIDADPENRDWLRGRVWPYPVDVEEFLAYLDRTQIPLHEILASPVARAMPKALRDKLVAQGVLPRRGRD